MIARKGAVQHRVAPTDVLYDEEGPGIGPFFEYGPNNRELRELGSHYQARLPWFENRLRCLAR